MPRRLRRFNNRSPEAPEAQNRSLEVVNVAVPGTAVSPAPLAAVTPPAPAASPGLFKCLSCRRSFSTALGLGSHRARIHGWKYPARGYAMGTRCTQCLKEFWASSKLLRHLREDKTRCLRSLIASGARPATADEAAEAAKSIRDAYRAAKHVGAHHPPSKRPARRAHGPARPL